ncbi:hypothetical protein ElyMa_006763600 [Elysia marginata]|uniref:Uncharacterized protein n=1 Tax=Elysia marginata TaxID=1093978 RepID=A0AAV4IZS1_9GAST|nr:hypothetical protein ElyMa_006763600 [Elysia marginata]
MMMMMMMMTKKKEKKMMKKKETGICELVLELVGMRCCKRDKDRERQTDKGRQRCSTVSAITSRTASDKVCPVFETNCRSQIRLNTTTIHSSNNSSSRNNGRVYYSNHHRFKRFSRIALCYLTLSVRQFALLYQVLAWPLGRFSDRTRCPRARRQTPEPVTDNAFLQSQTKEFPRSSINWTSLQTCV